MNLRDLFGVETKLKQSILKNKNQIYSTVTTRKWLLLTEWTRMWPSTGLVSECRNGDGPRLFTLPNKSENESSERALQLMGT